MILNSSSRFSVVQIKDAPWIVVDQACARRMVASSPLVDAAKMIAALMNGHIDQALESRGNMIAELNRLH
jgi:hypothetical protein